MINGLRPLATRQKHRKRDAPTRDALAGPAAKSGALGTALHAALTATFAVPSPAVIASSTASTLG